MRKVLATTKPRIYAKGALSLFSTKKQDYTLGIKLLQDCINTKRIAVANPKTAPYGQAAFEAIKNAKIYTHSRKINYSMESLFHKHSLMSYHCCRYWLCCDIFTL
ncbi:MAG: hypothetical protein Q9M40_13820 [Sulfurimonas sp.]|nr:hypothetical protein [Sulfurimonas sp.]